MRDAYLSRTSDSIGTAARTFAVWPLSRIDVIVKNLSSLDDQVQVSQGLGCGLGSFGSPNPLAAVRIQAQSLSLDQVVDLRLP